MHLENYSNVPLSIAELRAAKERSAEPWTPRDALISLLRDIDSHKVDPVSIVIVFDTMPEPGHESSSSTFYIAAVRGFHKAIGLLTFARFLMMKDT